RSDRFVLLLRRLPEREVANVVLLVLITSDPFTLTRIREVDPRKAAVVREPRDVEIDGTVRRGVGHLPIDETLDDLYHPGDVFGGPGIHIGADDPECLEVAEEGPREGLRIVGELDPAPERAGDRLVVDVGQVHDER